jgi:hypothetical protein
MVRWGVRVGAAAILVLQCWTGPGLGLDPVGRVAISGNLALAGWAMGDVDREIRRGNEVLRHEGVTTLDPLSFGFDFLADFQAPVKHPFYLSLGLGRLRGHTGKAFNKVIDIEARTGIAYARLMWMLPWRPLEDVRIFLGGGPLFLRGSRLEVSHERDFEAKKPERKETLSMKGSGNGFLVGVTGEYVVSDHVTLSLDAGYRWARADLNSYKITVQNAQTRPGVDAFADDEQVFWDSYLLDAFLKDPGPPPENQEAPNFDGPPIQELEPVDNLDLDFSGVRIQVGLRMYVF